MSTNSKTSVSSDVKVDVDSFWKDGYVLARGLFTLSEIQDFRDRIYAIRDEVRQSSNHLIDPKYPQAFYILGDLLGKKKLKDVDYVIFDDRIVSAVKQILGSKVTYFGDSSVQTGKGPRGFHKDNVDRADPSGLDWKGRYEVIRFGIYLEDHSQYSGGLKVRVGSHNMVSRHRGLAINLDTRPGDVAFWSLRTSHSGNNLRLKGWTSLCLHPRLEGLLPAIMCVPEQQERIAIFCSFGAPGVHLDRYIQYLSTRSDTLDHWKRSGFSPALQELANKKGVELRKPTADYGSLCSQ